MNDTQAAGARAIPPHIYGRLLREHRFGNIGTIEGKTIKLVLLIIKEHMNADGMAWPSEATIAAEAELSERSVRNVIHAASTAGWLALYIHAGHKGRQNWKSYFYRACCPDSIDLEAVIANKKTGQTAEDLAKALEEKHGEIPASTVNGGIFRQKSRPKGPAPGAGASAKDRHRTTNAPAPGAA